MKIACVVPMDSTIDNRFGWSYYLSKNQVLLGHTVDVLTSAFKPWPRAADHFQWRGIPNITTISNIDGIMLYRYKYLLRMGDTNMVCPQVFFRILKEDYDIIHCHYLLSFFTNAARLAAAISRKPFIITQHWLLDKNITKIHIRTKIQKVLMHNLRKIIALTPEVKQNLISYGFKPEIIEVIPSGIDRNIFKPHNDLAPVKHTLGVPLQNKVILFVGRFDGQKRTHILLYAFKKLNRRDVNLVLVGGGPYEMNLKILAKKLGISKQVVFCNFLSHDKLAKLYPIADVFVLPSREEPFGLVLLEAISSGVPIITTPTSGGKFITDICGGLLFETEEELINHLKTILSDEVFRRKLVKKGLNSIDYFSWEQIARKTIKLYNKIS